MVRVCVLRSAGTNCDRETGFAFEKAGAVAEYVHINRLVDAKACLKYYHVLAIPGGFTYGDDIAAGRIFANELRHKLFTDIKEFIRQGKLIIGICNGFQILVKAGLLPGNGNMEQAASLITNDSGKFEDRWTYLRTTHGVQRTTKCIWAKNLPEIIYLPVAHGEGKFVVRNKTVLEKLKKNRQIVFRYCDKNGEPGSYPVNPNGSAEDIAGICDETGRILGLMPHPERHAYRGQHPHWKAANSLGPGDGLKLFKNAVEYAKKHL